MKTYMAKPGEVEQKWWLVDATDKVVGRLASEIAMILMGKHRPTYTPHVDTGDFVVVINAEKVVLHRQEVAAEASTPGTPATRACAARTAGKRLERRPELILREAVRRMLPKNKLAVKMLDKLKIYAGAEHPHQAKSRNRKNWESSNRMQNRRVAPIDCCRSRQTSKLDANVNKDDDGSQRIQGERFPGHRPPQNLGGPRARSCRRRHDHDQRAAVGRVLSSTSRIAATCWRRW